MNEGIPWKSIVLIVAIIYFLSPVDVAPGILVDDLVLLGTALVPFLKKTSYN